MLLWVRQRDPQTTGPIQGAHRLGESVPFLATAISPWMEAVTPQWVPCHTRHHGVCRGKWDQPPISTSSPAFAFGPLASRHPLTSRCSASTVCLSSTPSAGHLGPCSHVGCSRTLEGPGLCYYSFFLQGLRPYCAPQAPHFLYCNKSPCILTACHLPSPESPAP